MNTEDLILVSIIFGVLILPYLINNIKHSTKSKTIHFNSKKKFLNSVPTNVIKIEEYESSKFVNLKNSWVESIRRDIYNYKSLIDLLAEFELNKINYSILLNSFEWQFKRFKILYRDNFKCVDCGLLSKKLHVHHLYYIKNQLPWEIEDKGLVSLCRNCHTKRHEIDNIFIYKKVSEKLVLDNENILKCPRCMGTGYLPQFKHVENGICFLCLGNIINKTVFSQRLQIIIQNTVQYDFNEIFDEFNLFISSIPSKYYFNYIHGKLYDEIDDFFSPDNTINYKPGQSELLDFLMKSEDLNTNHKSKKIENIEDDLPF